MTKTAQSEAVQELRTDKVAKYYVGVPALSDVSVAIHPGEIVGLIGHNGAGKSTLLKIFSGAHPHDEGQLLLDGKPVKFSSPADALKQGVATVYQELSLLPNLTITENIWLAREARTPFGVDKRLMRKKAQDIVDRFNINMDVDRHLYRYSVAQRQLLEIAIAATRGAKYLLLDEPTTALEGEQIDQLLDYIKQLAIDENLGVLIVNHKLDELYRICDRIVALVDGGVVTDAKADEVSHDEVVSLIAGEEVAPATSEDPQSKESIRIGETALKVSDLVTSVHSGVSLEVHKGEILGIYGLIGSGRTEFLRTLIGLYPVESGYVNLFDQDYTPISPKNAMKQGLVYLTEERKHDGIVRHMNSVLNVALPVAHQYTKAGWLQTKEMKRSALDLLDKLALRGNPYNPIVSLSGGNQQKVLLARALIQQPSVLLLDEPTKGVDIGVKTEIHRLLKRMAHDNNLAVIVVSSEEEEILDVSDTVTVFANGQTLIEPQPVSNFTTSKLRALAWSDSGSQKKSLQQE